MVTESNSSTVCFKSSILAMKPSQSLFQNQRPSLTGASSGACPQPVCQMDLSQVKLSLALSIDDDGALPTTTKLDHSVLLNLFLTMDPFTAINSNTDTLCSTNFANSFASNSFLSSFSNRSVSAHRSIRNQPHLYLDSLFATSVGVTIPVRYLGYVPLTSSINKLSPEMRIKLMNECIYRVRESIAKAKKQGRFMSHEAHWQVAQLIGNHPCITRSGLSAIVSVTLEHLTVIMGHSGESVQHFMSMVSYAFASVDGRFATYVAKHSQLGRCCMVLQCDTSPHLVLTISQAFDLRQQKHLDKAGAALVSTALLHRNAAQKVAIDQEGYVIVEDTEPQPNSYDIQSQFWYHGRISREEAERRICCDGDFLVRYSQITRGQFVLTGMLKNEHQHLFLVDLADHRIRNLTGQVFSTVKHFIEFHMQNGLGVDFEDQCKLPLIRPIYRP